MLYDEPPPLPDDYRWRDREPRHSGLGLASFVTSIVGVFLLVATFIATLFINLMTPGGTKPDSPESTILNILFFSILGVLVIALALGICGVMQKDRKAGWAIAGTIISGLVLSVLVVEMVLTRAAK